jgi:stage IV sporulation protein A
MHEDSKKKRYNPLLKLYGGRVPDKRELEMISDAIKNRLFGAEGAFDLMSSEHEIASSVIDEIRNCAEKIRKTGDIKDALETLENCEYIERYSVDEIDLGTGIASVTLCFNDALYYDVLSGMTGFEIPDEQEMIRLLCEYSKLKKKYERVAEALEMAEEKGYGIVMPGMDELSLNEPEIIKQSGAYGVKLSASAKSIHMIRANIETEINPIVGTEAQSAELIKYLLREFEEDPSKIWESNVFGKSLYELVGEGLHTKLDHMSEESRTKLSETLERIINEGSGGLICIIL